MARLEEGRRGGSRCGKAATAGVGADAGRRRGQCQPPTPRDMCTCCICRFFGFASVEQDGPAVLHSEEEGRVHADLVLISSISGISSTHVTAASTGEGPSSMVYRYHGNIFPHLPGRWQKRIYGVAKRQERRRAKRTTSNATSDEKTKALGGWRAILTSLVVGFSWGVAGRTYYLHTDSTRRRCVRGSGEGCEKRMDV